MRVGCLLLVFSTKACGMIVNLSVHRLAMVPNSEIQWYLLAMTRDAPCGQVILPGLFWESESPEMLLCMCVIWCVLMDFGRHLRVQKPAKYTVVCWTRFWVNFESMKKREKKSSISCCGVWQRFLLLLFVFMPASPATVSSRLWRILRVWKSANVMYYDVVEILEDFESVKVLDIFEDYESVNAADTDAVCQTGLL